MHRCSNLGPSALLTVPPFVSRYNADNVRQLCEVSQRSHHQAALRTQRGLMSARILRLILELRPPLQAAAAACLKMMRSLLLFYSVFDGMKMKGEGERDGSSDSGCCHSNIDKQIKYKLHIAAGSWWRVAVVWFGHSGGVDRVCEQLLLLAPARRRLTLPPAFVIQSIGWSTPTTCTCCVDDEGKTQWLIQQIDLWLQTSSLRIRKQGIGV
ncbi:hypothetical protein ABVT39_016138 [Epinephelus coioides]